jgi:hypothetical protein
MRIELALNGLPRLFDRRVRPELSIAGFTDSNERTTFRHDSQIAFSHAQVSHSLGHRATPVDIQTAPLPEKVVACFLSLRRLDFRKRQQEDI